MQAEEPIAAATQATFSSIPLDLGFMCSFHLGDQRLSESPTALPYRSAGRAKAYLAPAMADLVISEKPIFRKERNIEISETEARLASFHNLPFFM